MSFYPFQSQNVANLVMDASGGIYIPAGVVVTLSNADIEGDSSQTVEVNGELISSGVTQYVIYLVNDNNDLVIGKSGVIWSDSGIAIDFETTTASHKFSNSGEVFASEVAVQIGSNAVNEYFVNAGYMHSNDQSTDEGTLRIFGVGGFTTNVINSGLIENDAGGLAIYMAPDVVRSAHIVNTGNIIGGIVLYNNADYYDGHLGHHSVGSISTGGGNDTILGGSDNDVINGGTGADSMAGGAGNDTYYVDNAGDKVVEGANAGTDTILTGITLTLAANVENLATTSAAGTGAISLTGNTLANTITGNAGHNVIAGGDGADVITGGKGQDSMAGFTTTSLDDGDRDTFKFTTITDSGTATATEDVIYGAFNGGGVTADKIDLSAVPTGTSAAAFIFLGSAAFIANHPGEVRVTGSGTTYLVSLNTDNDTTANMNIVVHTATAHAFTAGDFVL